MSIPLQRPRWADPRLAVCGFETREARGPEAIANGTQVHGTLVHEVTAGEPAPAEGDGLWTASPNLPIAVRVADCVPILLWDPEAGVVGALHAGWRGTAANIVAAAFAAAPATVDPARCFAAIGPCISAARFEVGPEVVEGLRALGLGDAELGLRTGPSGRPHVDLRLANRALLRRAGLRDAHIEDVGGCTFSDPRYESYRREGAVSGRMRGIIALAPS